jgi:hypothetical protein
MDLFLFEIFLNTFFTVPSSGILSTCSNYCKKKKVKVHPITGPEGPREGVEV